jgi:uncharacterized protein
MVKLHLFKDVTQFYAYSKPFLQHDEARHCFLISLIHSLMQLSASPPALHLSVVEMDGKIVAIALKPPQRHLFLSRVLAEEPAIALRTLADHFQTHQMVLPGVSGLKAETEAFVQIWQQQTGQGYRLTMPLRLHQLHQVQPIPLVSGSLRLANSSDRHFLIQWHEAFELEALGTNQGHHDRAVDGRLRQNGLYLWCDPTPVSLVGYKIVTATKAWISPVYTPPDFRKRGYASACVAGVSQALLDQGCHCCLLFTDLNNPTSNHIYQTIGYEAIDDWYEYAFVAD